MPDFGIGEMIMMASTVTMADVASAAMVVGTVTSAVGAVTGNKTLTMIGAGLGLAGGIGSLAASSSFFSSGTSAMNDIFAGSDAGPGMMGGGDESVASNFAYDQSTAAPSGADLASRTTPVSSAAPDTTGVSAGTPSMQGMIQQQAPTSNVLPQGAAAPTAPTAQTGGGLPPTSNDVYGGMDAGPGIDPTQKQPPGFWDSLSASDKANLVGRVAAGGAQLVGGMAGGMFTAMSESNKMEFQKMLNQQQLAFRTQSPGLIQFQKTATPTGIK